MPAELFYDATLTAHLKALLKARQIFVRDEVAPNGKKLQIVGSTFITLDTSPTSRILQSGVVADNAKDFVLHPVLRDKGWCVWMGLRMRFELHPEGKRQLHHTSLMFARGDQDIRPMFRAEWDFRESKDSHCQPHWHFYSAIPTGAQHADPVDHQWAEFQEKLHMAMCAKWHCNEGVWSSVYKSPIGAPKDVVAWIEHVLSYVINQCEYALLKSKPIASDTNALAPQSAIQMLAPM